MRVRGTIAAKGLLAGKPFEADDSAEALEAAAYAAKLQRLDAGQFKHEGNLADMIDPAKYKVGVQLRPASDKGILAEVTYESQGLRGKGSTFREAYLVKGSRGMPIAIKDVTYGWNKATDQNGNDLDP